MVRIVFCKREFIGTEMPGDVHRFLTETSIRLLPDRLQQRIAVEQTNLIQRYCMLPDLYFDLVGAGHETAVPYLYDIDGIPFHYIPDTPIVPLYRYYAVNRESSALRLSQSYENPNWRHASQGFLHYFRCAMDAFRSGNLRDGCAFAGWLLHFLQDAGYGAHSLEGPYGTDIFVLQRLFPDSPDPAHDPISILRNSPPPPPIASLTDYRPCLLGRTPAEAAFHLYTRYVTLTGTSRRLCHRIVSNVHAGQESENVALFRQMFSHVAFLGADVLYTMLCAAHGGDDLETAHLETVFLSDMEPIQRPWLVAAPYGHHHALVRDATQDAAGGRHPLQLLDSGGAVTTFRKGLAMGAHYGYAIVYEIPHGLYRRFDAVIGLDPRSAPHAEVQLSLSVDGNPVHRSIFRHGDPGVRVHVDQPGGRIEFNVASRAGLQGREQHILWAEPVLQRQEDG